MSRSTASYTATPITRMQTFAFEYATALSFILYTLALMGVSVVAPKYLDGLLYFIRLYVGMFLLYRFNPYRTVRMTSLDRTIAYNAGFILVTADILDAARRILDWVWRVDKKDATEVESEAATIHA